MAATSLWHIEGRLKDLISYVENPEKTVPNKEMQDFFDVFSYVKNPRENGQWRVCFRHQLFKRNSVTAEDSDEKAVPEDRRYIAWHGYQSFKPDEVTPGTMPRNRLETGKGDVGRQVPDNRCHPP